MLLLGVVIVVMAGLVVVPSWRPSWLPSLRNPFTEETTVRSGPVVLQSVQDLSRFTAASGNFEVILDVETGRRFIPDIIAGERTLFVAAGSVDAYVEFGGLTEGAIVLDEANNAVEVTVPAPELTEPNIDNERSYVYAQERGVINRFGDFLDDDPEQLQEVLVLAEERIAEAATESELPQRAEENTRRTLQGMLGSLGFDVVTVTFAAP